MANLLKSKLFKLKSKSKAANNFYNFLHELKVERRKKLDDETFAQIYYSEKTGKKLNLINPITFDEKQWWLKFHYRNPLQTQCADKYMVRQYVADCGGSVLLNELYGVYNSVDELNLDDLPNTFFLKTNHGCGANFWCHDKAKFPIENVKKQLSINLKQNYYYESREWPYKDIKPRVIAEAVMEPKKPSMLIDYRFLCFKGRCEYVFIDINTCAENGKHRPDAQRNVYDRDGNFLDVVVTRKQFQTNYKVIPDNFLLMRMWAEKLSVPFPFVRVDLYSFDNIIRFGEMTFFHAGGVSVINPPSFQETLGELIVIPRGEYVI